MRRIGLLLLVTACSATDPPPRPAARQATGPVARVETEVVATAGDSADDPAIWIHPKDPARSLILGTNKKDGLEVYTLDGKRREIVSAGTRPNNVDVRYDVARAETRIDVAGASARGTEKGVLLWSIDPDGQVKPLTPRALRVLDGADAYGFCFYRRPDSGALFFFVSSKDGVVEQYRVTLGPTVAATRVRTLEVGSTVEGCVCDDEYGRLYVSEEETAIWCYGADPEAPPATRRKVAGTSGPGAFAADTEGLAIYHAADGKGYIVASSQGSDTYNVYRREGDNAFVKTIDPRAGPAIGDVEATDGLDVTNVPTSAELPKGFLIVQDGKNGARQNFKIFAWEDVAGADLAIDTTWDPRRPSLRRRGE